MCIQFELDLDTAAARLRQTHDVSHELKFTLRVPDNSAFANDRLIDGSITMRQLSLTLEYRFVCFGWDLAQFAVALRELQTNHIGTAEFTNQEESLRIRLSANDRRQDVVAVDASLQQYVLSTCTEEWSYPYLEFEGFGVDRAHMSTMVTQIESFLSETGINTEHPMI